MIGTRTRTRRGDPSGPGRPREYGYERATKGVLLPFAVIKALEAEASESGLSISKLLALALRKGRPDWPWPQRPK